MREPVTVRFIHNAANFRKGQEVEVTPENEELLKRMFERGKCRVVAPETEPAAEVTEPVESEPAVTPDAPEATETQPETTPAADVAAGEAGAVED